MNLIINSRTIELESYSINIRFNPYNNFIQCQINNDIDIDELSEFINTNYQGNFILNEVEYTNYPGMSINTYNNGNNIRTTLNFDNIINTNQE